jgi:hypothetical protein
MTHQPFLMRFTLLLFVAMVAAGCQTTRGEQIAMSTKPALELRAMQSRAFETTDRYKTVRAVVSTLQDLGYTIEKVETGAGTVTATKLSILRLSASVYPRNTAQMIVRANAVVQPQQQQPHMLNQVDDPEFYLKYFFEPLAKAMFLSALQIEDGDPEVPPPVQKTSQK